MNKKQVVKQFCSPIASPAYGEPPFRFLNREYLIISYETDMELLRRLIPEPLEVENPIVNFEVINMPDCTGLGGYTESGQVIPAIFQGLPVNYVHLMYLDSITGILNGREIFGFPKGLAETSLKLNHDHLLGEVHYRGAPVAIATMEYKRQPIDPQKLLTALTDTPSLVLKKIPHVDGTPRICELVETRLTDISILEAWSGSARLMLLPHIRVPMADLPIRKIISALHFKCHLTIPFGKVRYDYLK
jgi:acetoacetate decarboxylase